MKRTVHARDGFTLIEVVVTIIIGAIALVAILPFLGQVFLRSYEPRADLRDAMDLQAAMEMLVAVHTNDLETLYQHVGPEGSAYEGRFTVVERRFVDFPGNVESVTTNRYLLKITLENDLGEQVSRLFAVPL
jgi:prepilin-type N-terminal cleavage/methylation domain-containing protein